MTHRTVVHLSRDGTLEDRSYVVEAWQEGVPVRIYENASEAEVAWIDDDRLLLVAHLRVLLSRPWSADPTPVQLFP